MLAVVDTARFSVVSLLLRGSGPPSLRRVVAPPLSAAEGDAEMYERLRYVFESRGVSFLELCHGPTLTSEASVAARVAGGWADTTLASGAKAMLLVQSKSSQSKSSQFMLCVLAADRKLDWKKIKKEVAKDLRLATAEEVWTVARCLPGAVPPFASQFFLKPPPKTFMDQSLANLEFLNFNCGLRTRSARMSLKAYLDLEAPTHVDISA